MILTALTVSVQAQSPHPMGLIDLLGVPRLADPQLSPDGKDVLFTRDRMVREIGHKTAVHVGKGASGR